MIAIDQANVGETALDTAGATIVLTTIADVAPGGFIVLTTTCISAQSVSSVSGGGLTWSIDAQGTASGARVAIVSAQAPAGLPTGTVITVTLSASTAGGRSCFATSFTGVATSSPIDATPAVTTTSGSAWTSGNTIIRDGSLLIACAADFTTLNTSTPTSPSVEAHDAGNGGFAATVCYRIEPVGGTYSVDGTWSAAVSGAVIAVAYKAPDFMPISAGFPSRHFGPF